jgi:hypothetical protein
VHSDRPNHAYLNPCIGWWGPLDRSGVGLIGTPNFFSEFFWDIFWELSRYYVPRPILHCLWISFEKSTNKRILPALCTKEIHKQENFPSSVYHVNCWSCYLLYRQRIYNIQLFKVSTGNSIDTSFMLLRKLNLIILTTPSSFYFFFVGLSCCFTVPCLCKFFAWPHGDAKRAGLLEMSNMSGLSDHHTAVVGSPAILLPYFTTIFPFYKPNVVQKIHTSVFNSPALIRRRPLCHCLAPGCLGFIIPKKENANTNLTQHFIYEWMLPICNHRGIFLAVKWSSLHLWVLKRLVFTLSRRRTFSQYNLKSFN